MTIDFEQEIEGRLHHFQHLTGKGNVKDGNRTLYEILRLMLGMINQNGSTPSAPSPGPLARPFDEDAPISGAEPQTRAMDDDIAEYMRVPRDDEIATITPASLELPVRAEPSAPLTKPVKTWGDYKPADADGPFGYTRSGYARTSLPPNGLTEGGLPRKTPLRQSPVITTTEVPEP